MCNWRTPAFFQINSPRRERALPASLSLMHLFLTATDTEVGKTHVAAGLIRAWRATGMDAVGLKPFSAGSTREDAEALAAAMGDDAPENLDTINPVHLATPAAPLMATQLENLPEIDLAPVYANVRENLARHSHVVVEGVGGWRVPLTSEVSVREFAVELGLPVVVVARGGLGTLNHTVLTVDSIRDAGLEILGIFLNHGAPDQLEPSATEKAVRQQNGSLLEKLTGLPVTELGRQVEPLLEVPFWLAGKER